jgi:TonB-dependent starch-binding outer membrane protein SusC
MNLKLNTFLKNGLLLMVAIMLGVTVQAQRTVKGKLSDASSGEALIGANVVTTGSNAVTDVDGMYSINVPAGATVLTFSYTGYDSQTVSLGSSNVVDVALRAGKVLEDVVVVGYGSIKKSDATGAVSSITEKDFNKGVIVSPEQLMQGRVAGVQITAASGEPGGGVDIRIRGTSSIRSGNNPLFVIDGVPLAGDATSGGGADAGLGSSAARNPLNFLNPNDIERIDVLKDASSTAIYGSRGANGVVLITTKKGKEGKSSLDYGYSLGISNITKRYDLLNAADYRAETTKLLGAAVAKERDLGSTTDWQDEVFRTAYTHNHNLSYGGGNASGNYRFSVGYLNQDGIVKNTGLKKYTARFNAGQNLWNNRLKMGVEATIANTLDQGAPITQNGGYEGDLIGALLKSNPTAPAYTTVNGKQVAYQRKKSDGSAIKDEPTPSALLDYTKDNTNTLRALGNLNAELKIIDGLTFKTVVGFDRSLSSRKSAWSRALQSPRTFGSGRLYTNDIQTDNRLWENYFTYTKKFGSVDFTGLAGYSYQSFDNSGKRTQTAGFLVDDLDLMINNASAVDLSTVKNDKGEQVNANSFKSVVNSNASFDELQSYFGRLNFGISDKYLFTATMRADGSTKFGGDNKYGYFPSVAGKWRLIQENFIPKTLFSDLALRAGWGITGNQEIPHNLFDGRQRYSDLNLNDGGSGYNDGGLNDVSFANPNLKWETTNQINVGLDFGFANNRISGSVDYYNKNTTGSLVKTLAAQPAPNKFKWENLDANIINKGIELSLNVVAVNTKDFNWTISGNVAHNTNTVTNFGERIIQTGRINGQGLSEAYAQAIANNQPLYAYYLREFDGFSADGSQQKYIGGDVQNFVGKSPLPKVVAGLTNSFSYKGLDLSVFFNGAFGHYIYNNTANAYFTVGSFAGGRNVPASTLTTGESARNSPDVSTRFLEKGNFVRLSNISLGYTIKPTANVSAIRIFAVAQNLMTFTKYSGQDPEVNTNKAIDDVPSASIDYTAYPRARTITVGANVTF